jgi:hypothetical protein
MPNAPIRRCAVYTRKSSEEGLAQDFNSLHAQREACEVFVARRATPAENRGIASRCLAPPCATLLPRPRAESRQSALDETME